MEVTFVFMCMKIRHLKHPKVLNTCSKWGSGEWLHERWISIPDAQPVSWRPHALLCHLLYDYLLPLKIVNCFVLCSKFWLLPDGSAKIQGVESPVHTLHLLICISKEVSSDFSQSDASIVWVFWQPVMRVLFVRIVNMGGRICWFSFVQLAHHVRV